MNLAASAWPRNSSEWFERPYGPEAAVRPTWPLDLVKLNALMDRSEGLPRIAVGLIDGPVWMLHPDLAVENIRPVSDTAASACSVATSTACSHGTYVAGILAARRSSMAPALCPGCTLLVRPVFSEAATVDGTVPSATPGQLAAAIVDTVNAGARVLNLSLGLVPLSPEGEDKLIEALDYAARRSVIVVAAAGNQGTLGSSPISRHGWVIPVAACDFQGRPVSESNLGSSIGRRGLSAPGDKITSLGTAGKPRTLGGTSAAAPFVTGALALLWSQFPDASGSEVKLAVIGNRRPGRSALVPPLLNAWIAFQTLYSVRHGRSMA